MNSFIQNRNKLFERLEIRSIVMIHSGNAPHKTTDQFYPFQVNKNFYYLTGINESNCTLVMMKTESKTSSYLFIDETTEYMRQWLGAKISKEDASSLSGIDTKMIMYNTSLDSFIENRMAYSRGAVSLPPEICYFDLYRPTISDDPLAYQTFKKYMTRYPELLIKNINEHLSYIRMFKNEEEIQNVKKAIAITNEGIKRMMREVKHRYYENQLEADFMHEITLNGTRKTGFDTILASGKNATILHYEDNNQKIPPKSLILCDLGAEWKEYSADISRTFPCEGTFTPRQKELYEIVLKVNKETIAFVKPGISWKELEDFAKDLFVKECTKIGLIQKPQELRKYYYHSIGHFLGLDVHDVGQSELLREGMLLTIEPGLYIEEEEIGIRIEDNVLITKGGCMNLSEEIIKEVDDIERYMK